MTKTVALLLLTLLSSTAYAQGLTLFFESLPGQQPAGIVADLPLYAGRFDANGDGTRDLILRRNDGQNRLQDIRALDGETQEVLLEIRDVPGTLSLSGMDVFLVGFSDVFGDGRPQALFSSDTEVVAVNPGDNSTSFRTLAPGPIVLLNVTDLTGDGIDDLIISLTETRQVQVWSIED